MEYQKTMDVLSQYGFGALLVTKSSRILDTNEVARQLLHISGDPRGQYLHDFAAPFCEEADDERYVNIAFGEYLKRCMGPKPENLPPDTRFVVFRDATNDACHDMLLSAINQISESVILCDAESRIWLINDQAVQMDGISTEDVRGESVLDVYQMLDGNEMAIPRVIQSKHALIGLRQLYATRYGKTIDIVSNNYPIIQNGQILGAFNVMRDWSEISDLHKKILDLQSKLIEQSTSIRKKGKSVLSAKYTFNDIFSLSPAMVSVVKQCKQVAQTDSSVMLYGETGTGKELFAQSIHNASRRARNPFLAINCAAIPENLLESLLFGTERGAYTGAESRPGLFEQANGGTLLLDEINSMNINLQSKLLRVLQDGVIRRVGSTSEIQVNVRVLSNINIPPYQAIEENKLRRDLFYRLGVVNINIPPLRDRTEDLALLSKYFIMQCNKKLSRNVSGIDEETLKLFQAYQWPGNVRELQHAIEHAMNILPFDISMIAPQYIPYHIRENVLKGSPRHENADAERSISVPVRQSERSLGSTVRGFERQMICDTLKLSHGNITAAARSLQMSRQNLQYYIKRYQIDIAMMKKEI